MIFALASAALVPLLPASAEAADRTLPMHFYVRLQGPADACGGPCRLWISASGAITAETPRDFELFARGHDLTGATMVLDSDGGSVLGAIALGRDIRRLGLDTTVGSVVDLNGSDQDAPRGKFSPVADCESMCGFVLLGGVHRTVPPQARVMVHQIWLGDRRDDPTAANYSAEDLVLVQRDIGRLAQYTIDMGGSIELLNLALRIPPWEPMHALTRGRDAPHQARDRAAAGAGGGHRRGLAGCGPRCDAADPARDRWRACHRDQRTALGGGRSRRGCVLGAASAADRRRRGHRQLRSDARVRRRHRQL